jgi:hypothetical protein
MAGSLLRLMYVLAIQVSIRVIFELQEMNSEARLNTLEVEFTNLFGMNNSR